MDETTFQGHIAALPIKKTARQRRSIPQAICKPPPYPRSVQAWQCVPHDPMTPLAAPQCPRVVHRCRGGWWSRSCPPSPSSVRFRIDSGSLEGCITLSVKFLQCRQLIRSRRGISRERGNDGLDRWDYRSHFLFNGRDELD